MTSTFFIDAFFREFPNYISCIPSDLILNMQDCAQNRVSGPCFLIVNTSPSYIQTTGHWLTIIIYNRDKCEIFDSLAAPKEQLPSKILFFFKKFKKVIFSPRAIQSPISNFCGVFAIARAISACRRQPLKDFYRNFKEDLLLQNDSLATKYILDNISSVY